MHKTLLLLLILLGATVAFVGYYIVLTDWLRDYANDVYRYNRVEAIIESAALLLYTYFGIKFFNRHIGSLR